MHNNVIAGRRGFYLKKSFIMNIQWMTSHNVTRMMPTNKKKTFNRYRTLQSKIIRDGLGRVDSMNNKKITWYNQAGSRNFVGF